MKSSHIQIITMLFIVALIAMFLLYVYKVLEMGI